VHKVLKLKATISPQGEILLDNKKIKAYHAALKKSGEYNTGGEIDVRVLLYPVKERGNASLNINLPLTVLQESEVERIANKQRTEKEAVVKLINSRGSIKEKRFRENVLKILNG
jgi:hypothetical protein